MTSWDFFDTLSGRATGHEPWRLFDHVGGEEYRRVRQLAEIKSDKTWPGIFRSLEALTGWPAARVAELREREWQAELAAAFPILENVRRVRPGDRIVSDTYFSAPQVRELAGRIGIPRSVEIVTSWDGKHSGAWWKTPAAAAAEVHVGDNHRSDYLEPRRAGHKAEAYTNGRQAREEQALADSGRWEVAAAMRAARLQNIYAEDGPAFRAWASAAQANVRFLILAAALVRQYVEAARPKRVLFVSRDTLLLQEAYRRFWQDIEVGTFWSSRQALTQPSRDYLTYVKSIASGALFVDLHGTGRSVRAFEAAAGVELAYVFVCGQRRLPARCHRLVDLPHIGTGTAVEVMNYDAGGRVLDVVDGEPVRATVEYDLELVAAHRTASLLGVASCCQPPAAVRTDEVAEAARAVEAAVSRELLAQHQVHHHDRPATTGRVVRRRIRR